MIIVTYPKGILGGNMRAASAQELKTIDKACVEQLGIPMTVLMENAALRLLRHVDTGLSSNYCIVCGSGNNGGDALALARHLHVNNHKVKVFFLGTLEKGTDCFKINFKILQKMKVEIVYLDSEQTLNKLREAIRECSLIIDGIFGIGINRKVDGLYFAAIDIINGSGKEVIAIDIPSGLNCDSGEAMGICIKASKTISFETYKVGFFSYEALNYIGEVVIEKIGIPNSIIESFTKDIFITNKNIVKNYIDKRGNVGHKGSFGKTLIIGGSKGYYGAVLMAAMAAVRSGSGLITVAGSSDVVEVLRGRLTEAMALEVSDDRFKNNLGMFSGAAIGPGLGVSDESIKLLKFVLDNIEASLVIDADGLNIISKHKEWLKMCKHKLILTPHSGEMSRLTGKSVDYIDKNRISIAREFAKENSVILLLKGYNTIVTDGYKVFINSTGNSAMSNGGMGDSLTGIIASFVSQGIEPLYAAVCGAYVHGYCGEELSKNMHSVTACDVIDKIPFALKELLY